MFLAKKLNRGAGTPVALDPQFNYVTMLLHGDGTNGAQNNTFLDSSTNNFTITRNGNTTQGSFSPYGSNWSNYIGGTGNYLTTATSASEFSFGTGDFTIEFWINSTQTTRCDPIGQNNTFSSSGWWGLIGNLSSSGQLQWFENANSRISATATNWNNGSWNHIAVTRSGNSVRMFVNGTQVGSTYTTSFTYGASSVGVIAGVLSDDKTTGPLTGYLSNFRIVKGTALYTGAFTPSTTPLTAVSGTSLLTCQANRFFDSSTNALTITATGTPSVQRFNPFGASTAYSTSVIGGSGFLDGTGDYLNTASNAAFTLGSSGNFTVECWVYLNGSQSASYAAVMTNMGNFSTQYGNRWAFTINGLNLRWYNSNGDGVMDVSVVPFQWIHLAAVRSGSTITIYVNGIAVAGQTANQAYTTEGSLKIGFLTGAAAFKGYITDARVVIGTAVYTADFTPPTAPLTAITNTTFLANTTNGAIFDNAMMNNLETVGNAQISTSVVKYGTGSMYFDGTGDYLLSAPSNDNILGGGDFTIEFWLYPSNTSSGYRALVASENYNATTGGWSLYQNGTSIELWGSPGASSSDQIINATSAITTSTWQHLALSRASGTLRLFLNGISVASVSNSTSFTGQQIWISDNNSGSYFYDGYIDDLRITKGYARYTSTFTPPTAAFPNIGPV